MSSAEYRWLRTTGEATRRDSRHTGESRYPGGVADKKAGFPLSRE